MLKSEWFLAVASSKIHCSISFCGQPVSENDYKRADKRAYRLVRPVITEFFHALPSLVDLWLDVRHCTSKGSVRLTQEMAY